MFVNISNTTTIVHPIFFPFYMVSTTFVPTLVVSWNFVGGRLLDAYNFNKNFYTSNMFVVFPKLIHFYFILFSYIANSVLVICLDLFVQGKLANLERKVKFLPCIVKEHLHFHISVNLIHFACLCEK